MAVSETQNMMYYRKWTFRLDHVSASAVCVPHSTWPKNFADARDHLWYVWRRISPIAHAHQSTRISLQEVAPWLAKTQAIVMALELPKATNSTPSVSSGDTGGVETGPGSKTPSPQPLVKRSSPSSASWRLNRMRILEVVVLSSIIIVDWGLFMAPTIVYALPPLQVGINTIILLQLSWSLCYYKLMTD